MTIPWWTAYLQAPFLHSWFGDTTVLVVLQVTAILAIALAIAAAFPKAAAIRSCILLSALFCTLGAPLALLVNSHTGYILKFPLHVPAIESQAAVNGSPVPLTPIEQRAAHGHSDRSSNDIPTVDRSRPPIRREEVFIGQNRSPQASSATSTMTYRTCLLVLWACGTLFGVLGIVIAKVRIHKLVRVVKPIDRQRFHTEIAEAAANLGIDEFPRVGTSWKIGSPVALGFAQSAWILIPHQYLNTLSSRQLVQVLTHEAAHVIRHDPLIRLCQRVHQAIWWWNPLAHRLNTQLSRAREENCDNVVLSCTNAGEYGATLLALAKLICQGKPFVGTVGLFGSRWSLEHRINGLLNPRRNIMTQVNRSVVATILSVFVSVTFFTSAARIDARESTFADQDRPSKERDVNDRQFADRESEARQESQHMALHRQFNHLTAAYRHLKAAGLEDLAQKAGQRAEAVGKKIEQGHPHPGQTDRARSRYRNPLSDAPERAERRGAEERVFIDDVRASLRHLHLELRNLRRDVDELQDQRGSSD